MALHHKKWVTTAFLLGLTPLIRPEGYFAIGLLAVGLAYQVIRSAQKISWRGVLVMLTALLLPSLILVAATTAYYGSPVPQSIAAKRAGVYPLTVENSTLDVLKAFIQIGPWQGLMSPIKDLPSFITAGVIISVMTLAAIMGMIWMARQSFSYHLFPLLLALLVLFYATSKTFIFPHYVAHFEILAKVCLLAGLVRLMGGARLVRRHESLRKAVIPLALMTVLWPNLYNYPVLSVIEGQADARDHFIDQEIERLRPYRVLAQQIAPLLPENTVVAMPEIGELGFFLPDVKVLDACGLVSPEAVDYLPVPPDQRPGPYTGVVPPGLIRDYQPDLIILYEIFGRYGILDDAWFWEDYSPVIVRQGDWLPWESTALYVFSRKNFLPGQALADAVPSDLATLKSTLSRFFP